VLASQRPGGLPSASRPDANRCSRSRSAPSGGGRARRRPRSVGATFRESGAISVGDKDPWLFFLAVVDTEGGHQSSRLQPPSRRQTPGNFFVSSPHDDPIGSVKRGFSFKKSQTHHGFAAHRKECVQPGRRQRYPGSVSGQGGATRGLYSRRMGRTHGFSNLRVADGVTPRLFPPEPRGTLPATFEGGIGPLAKRIGEFEGNAWPLVRSAAALVREIHGGPCRALCARENSVVMPVEAHGSPANPQSPRKGGSWQGGRRSIAPQTVSARRDYGGVVREHGPIHPPPPHHGSRAGRRGRRLRRETRSSGCARKSRPSWRAS